MQTITRFSGAPRSALGFLIAPLIAGRTDAQGVFDRYLAGTGIGRRVMRAIRHGSLVDGELKGPKLAPPGAGMDWLPPELDRPWKRRSARRMLAFFFILAERMDPYTGTASGRFLWQGHQARRLGFSLRRDELGRLGGIREVQRYLRLFDKAEVFGRSQPDADKVPEHMRGKPKPSKVRGVVSDRSWSYNKVWTIRGFALPEKIRTILRRWRGEKVPKPSGPAKPPQVPQELAAVSSAADALAWLLRRPDPT